MEVEAVEAIERQIVQIKLVPAQTADEKRRNIVANIVVEGHTTAVPYIDDAITATGVTPLEGAADKTDERPRLRYYAVGPSTYKMKCPLCRQTANAAVMRGAGLKDATCCLSWLSFVFPVFWLCFICTWCSCNREWTTNGLYCNRCGGKLGKFRKPK